MNPKTAQSRLQRLSFSMVLGAIGLTLAMPVSAEQSCNHTPSGYTYYTAFVFDLQLQMEVAHGCLKRHWWEHAHDGATGYLLNWNSGDALWLDISRNGGADWQGLVDYTTSDTIPGYEYDGPGYSIRACGNRYGYVACTDWN
ncbi:MAG: hypothetical protein PHE55_05220 [Methylococcaceae bacterium]|nr:hypothetical protein [Methylococcaceae bacterium]